MYKLDWTMFTSLGEGVVFTKLFGEFPANEQIEKVRHGNQQDLERQKTRFGKSRYFQI